MEFKEWMLWIAAGCAIVAAVLCFGKLIGLLWLVPWPLALIGFVPGTCLLGVIVLWVLGWMRDGAP